MPFKKALKAGLEWSGLIKIYDSDCFKFENFNIKDIRYACIAEKNSDGVPGKYYTKQSSKSNYLLEILNNYFLFFINSKRILSITS